jgi:hypothetical protein
MYQLLAFGAGFLFHFRRHIQAPSAGLGEYCFSKRTQRRVQANLSPHRPRPRSAYDEVLRPLAPGEEYLPRKSVTSRPRKTDCDKLGSAHHISGNFIAFLY